ncbi:hypothetical protein ACP70R_025178 [Stipagrostis hirtigluma subsp. patula]
MADDEEPLVQESTVSVVSGADPSRCSVRLARILLPRAHGRHGNRLLPFLPSPPRDPGPVLGGGALADFKGWAGSPRRWREWVEKLRPRHEALWREAGILDGILASAYRVRRDEGALLQVAAFWSPGTNTFVLPWGEATVTLEDVAALAGLPLVGCSVRARLTDKLEKETAALEAARAVLNQSKNRKPSYGLWMKHFLERKPEEEASAGGGGGEARLLVEHGAFLSMWLSRFVLSAHPSDVVRPETFPIAVRLARGQSVALAPAALASIYHDLTALKRHLDLCKKNKEPPFVVSAPMHILQLWVWERFPELRPEMSSSLAPDAPEVPRVARWHDNYKVHDSRYVYGVLMSPKEFEWRPYGSSSFSLPLEISGRWVHGQDIARCKAMLSFARCLHPCELVGMNCIEKYRPHRVARQLGFDQDVPGGVPRQNSKCQKAWGSYNIEATNFAFIVPNGKPGVTAEYAQWWQSYSSACATAVANAAKMKRLHDWEDDIPLVERLRGIAKRKRKQHSTQCLMKGPEQKVVAKVVDSSGLICACVGDKNAVSLKDAQETLTDSVVGSTSIVDESSCASVTKKPLGKYLQQSKEGDHVIADDENNSRSEYGDVLLDNAVQGAVSNGSNEAVGAASDVDMLQRLEDIVMISSDESDKASDEACEVSTMHLKPSILGTQEFPLGEENQEIQLAGTRNHEQKCQVLNEMVVHSNHDNIIVISDDEFDEATSNDDAMHTTCLKTPKMETTGSIVQEQNEEKQLVNERNDEPEDQVLKETMVQSNRDCELATVLNDITLRQELDVSTHAATAQTDVEIDDRDKLHKEKMASLDYNEKGIEAMSVSNQELESLMEANRKRSGNSERSSHELAGGNTILASTEVCTKTLYYLSRFDRSKDAWDRDANNMCADQDVYRPKRAVGTMEMIKRASAIRQAEIAELKKSIDKLKEEILALEAAEQRKPLKK